MSDTNEPTQGGALPSVPLQPVVGTPRSDEACEDAEVWASRNPKGPVVPYRLAARMERELHHALCSIRQLLNDGVQVQNLNNGEVDVFRADVDGIVKFLEEASAEEYAARISSNPMVHPSGGASPSVTGATSCSVS